MEDIINLLFYYGKYFLTGIGIGIGLYYAQFTIPIMMWLKGGVENQDGKLENKDLQIAFVSWLMGFIVITSYLGASYSDAIVYGGWATLAGLFGIKEIFNKKGGI